MKMSATLAMLTYLIFVIFISCENRCKFDIQIPICPPEGYEIIFDGENRYTWRIPGSRYMHVVMFETANEAVNNAWLLHDSQIENFYRYNWAWDVVETCES